VHGRFSSTHLQRVLKEYIGYYEIARPHSEASSTTGFLHEVYWDGIFAGYVCIYIQK